jgi:hypothetical protein
MGVENITKARLLDTAFFNWMIKGQRFDNATNTFNSIAMIAKQLCKSI